MKTLKLFLAFAFVAMATTVSAEQRVENQSPAPAVDFNNGWDRVFVSYNASSMMFDYKGAENVSFPGFSLGYMKGFSVSNKLPFYVEAGAALQFRSHKEDMSGSGYEETVKQNFFSRSGISEVRVDDAVGAGKVRRGQFRLLFRTDLVLRFPRRWHWFDRQLFELDVIEAYYLLYPIGNVEFYECVTGFI